uniref:Uncharacterized protein n=1 Tax=Anguilla anguilla TaxID=7936 RepID=A0A0E9R319_ANGAN
MISMSNICVNENSAMPPINISVMEIYTWMTNQYLNVRLSEATILYLQAKTCIFL